MKIYKLFVIFFILQNCLAENLKVFLGKILKKTMENPKSIMTIFDEWYPEEIDKILQTTQTTRVNRLFYDNFTAEFSESHRKNGYVIIFENRTKLEKLFTSKHEDKFHFTPHITTIIFDWTSSNTFLNKSLCKDPKTFNEFSENFGIEIIIICDYNIKNPTNVTVYSTFIKNVLAFWTFNESFASFEARNWKPAKNIFVGSAFNCPPFIYLDEEGKVKSGIEFLILEEIMKGRKFEIKIYNFDETVSLYTRILNDSLHRKTDLSMCSQWRTVLTKKPVDVSYPYAQLCITFLVHKPALLPMSTFIYQPLAPSLWILNIFLVLTLSVIFFYIEKTYSKIHNLPKSNKNHIIYTLQIAFNSPNFPSQTFTFLRILVTSWCITTVLLCTGYSAGFTSTLTSPGYSKSIDTLQDMVDQKIFWGGPDYANRDTLVGSAKASVLNLLKNYNIEKSVQEINDRLRTGKYGAYVKTFPGYVTDTEFLDNYGQSNLNVLSDCAANNYMVFGLPLRSPYKKLFDEKILAFSEHGLLIYWSMKVLTFHKLKYMRNFFTKKPKIDGNHALTVNKLQGIFYFLCAGYLVSMFAFVVEIRLCKKRSFVV